MTSKRCVCGIIASGTKGFTDAEIIQALVTMQIAGRDALDHLDYCKGVLDTGPSGMKIPSPSTARALAVSGEGIHDCSLSSPSRTVKTGGNKIDLSASCFLRRILLLPDC